MSAERTAARISVITPCLNGARDVAEAIDSVLGRGYPNMEHIVVDGGSTDGTLELLSTIQFGRCASASERSRH